MLPRWAITPDGHWSVGLGINHNHCVRCGRMIFIGGQVDLDMDANQLNPGDLHAQAARSMVHVATLLAEAGAEMADLVKLTVFYVSDGSVDEADLLGRLAASMGHVDGPGPAITLVPLEALAFPGMEIEIEGLAMRDLNGPRLRRTAAWDPDGPKLPPPFVQALRCDEMVFTSGITAVEGDGNVGEPGSLTGQSRIVLPRIDRLLRQLGADLDDTVKTNVWNVEPGTAEDWRAPALARAGHFREPGPAATGISLPRLWPEGVMLRNDVIAMRGVDGARMARSHVWPTGHWDWPAHLPYRHGLRCGDLVFLGGQVSLAPDGAVLDPGDMVAQTATAMDFIGKVLDELGLGFEHVVKINTFYNGSAGVEDLRRNAEVRFSRFTSEPGPASTGVPVPYLAYEDMMIEIDIIAMV